MTNPWDPVALTTRGDLDRNHTYAGIGTVTDQWECIEFELARLYSVFIGRSDDWEAYQEYGAGRIFVERLSFLERVANDYFISRPCQAMEGEFHRIVTVATGFSKRRHEVAHGMVADVAQISWFASRLVGNPTVAHAVIPPHYAKRFHDDGMPLYAYDGGQLYQLALRLNTAWTEIADFRRARVAQP